MAPPTVSLMAKLFSNKQFLIRHESLFPLTPMAPALSVEKLLVKLES